MYDILFYFSSGENIRLKIKDIDNLLSSYNSAKKWNYKYTDTEWITYIINLNKVEYMSYISNEQIEEKGQLLDNNLAKFL
jgi:hypothetical protein